MSTWLERQLLIAKLLKEDGKEEEYYKEKSKKAPLTIPNLLGAGIGAATLPLLFRKSSLPSLLTLAAAGGVAGSTIGNSYHAVDAHKQRLDELGVKTKFFPVIDYDYDPEIINKYLNEQR